MRINCDIHINSRQLASQNLPVKNRGTRSSLAIGKQPGKLLDSSNLFIHICTLKNKQGSKFKIGNNIQAIFTKFVEEGKFTIQLKEPPLDLCVKAEPSLAKEFLKLFKLAIVNKNLDKLPFSHLNPVKQCQIEKPKTKLTISSRKDYPLTSSFPHKLEFLCLSDLKLNRIERRITNLKWLCNLDISGNQIKEIPSELGSMHCLSMLSLKKNKISQIPNSFFNQKIKETLSFLDLSNNELSLLPHTIVKFKKLDTLNLSNNKLRDIPYSIGRVTKLKHLNLSQNLLRTLPMSTQNLLLESFDVCGNPFDGMTELHSQCLCSGEINLTFKSLKEFAAISCIQQRVKLDPSEIPYTLCEYLDNYVTCLCGRIVVQTYLLAPITVQLKKLSSSVTSDKTSVPAVGTFCTTKCMKRFMKYQ